MKVKLNHYHLKRFTVFFLQSKHGKLCKLEEVKSNEENQGGLVKMIIKIELDKDLKTNEVISINVVKTENEIIEGKLFEVNEISKAEINEKAPTQE